MSAAAIPARAPLAEEGKTYWEDLIGECMRQIKAINDCASKHGLGADHLVRCVPDPGLHMLKSQYPSTSVKVSINYCPWGPMIDGIVTGYEDEDREFCPEEFTVPIAMDLDGSVVVVYEEGRSFSPAEFASFLTQNFRRCFPCLSLPCNEYANSGA